MSDTLPSVSVIVPAWNAAAFVGCAIESALAQTGVRPQVIVVDDASTDATREAVARFDAPDVIYHRLERNSGPGGARNAGLALAQGRWIAILDADDAFRPGRLARMVALGEGRGADIVVDNLALARDGVPGAEMFEPEAFAQDDGLDLAAFIEGNTPLRSEFNLGYLKPLIRRDFLERHSLRYDPGLRIGEDFVLLADCLAAGALCVRDPQAGYLYTQRDASISHRLGIEQIEAMADADRRFSGRWTLSKDERAALARRRRALADVSAFTISVDAIKARDWRRAVLPLLRRPASIRHFRYAIAARLPWIGRRAPAPAGRE